MQSAARLGTVVAGGIEASNDRFGEARLAKPRCCKAGRVDGRLTDVNLMVGDHYSRKKIFCFSTVRSTR